MLLCTLQSALAQLANRNTLMKFIPATGRTLGFIGFLATTPAPLAVPATIPALMSKISHSCVDFCISSYNVDGLSTDIDHSRERCNAVSRLIIDKNPDLIFLQEVTAETINHYTKLFGTEGYNLVSPKDKGTAFYFTVAFSKLNGLCKRLDFRDSAQSGMGRDILSYELIINNRRTQFLSSHLESLADGGEVRKAQLEFMLERIDGVAGPAVVAGDFNIRQKEADSLMSLFKKKAKVNRKDFKIYDCWESMGKDPNFKNTWVHPDPSLKHIQARYDRIYCNGKFIKTTEFSLIGKEEMPPPVSTTPSDHFGMIARFVIEKNEDVSNDVCISDDPCITAAVVESSSDKVANQAPNTITEGASESIDSPIAGTAKKARAQSPKRKTEGVKRKNTDDVKISDGDTADTELLEEKAKRRLVREAAATKRLLKSDINVNVPIIEDISVSAALRVSPKAVAKSGEKEKQIAVKRKEMCNDDDVIDLSLDMSPEDKKLL